MAIQTVSLETLDKLDPKLQAAFATHLKRAVQDCLDRPGEKHARRVFMALDIVPILDDDGGCSRVQAEFNFRDKLPDRRSRPFELIANRHGTLMVNENSPHNPNQMTIDDIPAPGAEAQVPKLPPTDGKSAAAGD